MAFTDSQLEMLLARCALRDSDALKTLFENLGSYFNAIAFRLLRSEELSNDVLQEAFVQIWLNAGSYRADLARPLTWMASIVRYRALDRLAKERRHWDHEVVEDDPAALDNFSGSDDPEQAVHDHKVHGQIQTCMQLLSERNRRCVELAYLEGYSREQIATLFNTNINTVKSWLRRGAERLRECLETKVAYRI